MERLPEIFPDMDIIRIKPNGKKKITCKTNRDPGIYYSYLTWYRRDNSGNLIKIDSSKVMRSSDTIGGNHIDNVILKFDKFSLREVGDYVCQRQVLEKKPTQKVVRIEILCK